MEENYTRKKYIRVSGGIHKEEVNMERRYIRRELHMEESCTQRKIHMEDPVECTEGWRGRTEYTTCLTTDTDIPQRRCINTGDVHT